MQKTVNKMGTAWKDQLPMHYGLTERLIRHIGHITISIGLWKDLPSTCGVRIQSSLGHQAMEHEL
jgi:hypothetical protein